MSDDDRMNALLRQVAAEEYNRPPDIVPREQMWDVIRQGLSSGEVGTGRVPTEGGRGEPGTEKGRELRFERRVPRWVYLAVAAVLLLAVGIQFGRMMGPGDQTNVVRRDSLGPDSAPRNAPAPDRDIVNVDPRTDDGPKGPQPRPRPGGPERQTDPSNLDGSSRAYTLVAAQHLMQVEALLTTFKGDLNQGRMDAEMASWGKELLSNTRLLLDSPVASDPVRRKLLQDLELVLVQIVQLSPNTSARDRDLIKGALTDDQVLTRIRTAIPAQKGT